MENLSFECETITPMFMAGADGKTPEIRAASIKGALRFWWRAMHGNMMVEELRESEAAIFGGSRKGEGRSKVIVRVEGSLTNRDTQYQPVPHKNFKLPAIQPEYKYHVSLSLLQPVKYNKGKSVFNIDNLKSLYILTVLLGGLGKRSRRGMGSSKILTINQAKYSPVENLNEQILNHLNCINFSMDKPFFIKDGIIKSKFKNKFPFILNIKIGGVIHDYDHLLLEISKATSNIRKGKKYDNRIKSLGFCNRDERLASPIYISIIENEKNGYQLVITVLKTIFKGNMKPDGKIQKNFVSEIIAIEEK